MSLCVCSHVSVFVSFSLFFLKHDIQSPRPTNELYLSTQKTPRPSQPAGRTDVHNCSPFTLFRVGSIRTWRLENKVFIRNTVQYVCFLINKLSCVEQTLAKSDRLYVCCLSRCILQYTKKMQFKYLNTFTIMLTLYV